MSGSTQPSNMPIMGLKHGGIFWNVQPTEAPTIKETQIAKKNEVTFEPTPEPTQPPNELPKHGGIYRSLPPAVVAAIIVPRSKTETKPLELLAPITTNNFAIQDRSFKGAEALVSRPTKRPTTPRPSTSKPTRRPTQSKPSRKPSVTPLPRKPSGSKPTRGVTSSPIITASQDSIAKDTSSEPSDMPTMFPKHGGVSFTITPSAAPSMKETQIAKKNEVPTQISSIQPTDMPTMVPKHGGVFWTLPPTPAPSMKETQIAKKNEVTPEPTQEPTQPPIELPKHGGVYRSLPPSFRLDMPTLPTL
jgi:hypothetical protein